MRSTFFISVLLLTLSLFGHAVVDERKLRIRNNRTNAPSVQGATFKPTRKPRTRGPRRRQRTRNPSALVFPTAAPVVSATASIPPTKAPVSPTVQPTELVVKPTLNPTLKPTAKPTPTPITPTFAPVASAASDPLANEWLTAHNTRRTAFFALKSKSPKNLKWSNTLAASALNYSTSLVKRSVSLNACKIVHDYQGNAYGGENLAANTGAASLTPEQVLNMWFDNEKNSAYGSNFHFTQVAWRSTSYVGCGIDSRKLPNGDTCFVQTCRYLAPGNCNINIQNLFSQVLRDTSDCPPLCPVEGCS